METSPVRLLIHGASGRMGSALLRLAAADARVRVVAAVSRRGAAPGADPVPWLPAARVAESPDFDVAIDFSLPEAFDPVLALCCTRGAALVSGTTGLSTAQLEALDAASADIAIVWAANYSLGVAVLAELVRRAAQALPGWDADIVEAHHVHKKDAPSGTALALGRAVAAGRGTEPHYASVRAGDIVGEHTVQLSGPGERLELVHRATDRDVFARGAIEAAVRVRGREPGRHALADLLFANSAD
jgi:4-hydroxy-tetrahydrodipicolinate reductase